MINIYRINIYIYIYFLAAVKRIIQRPMFEKKNVNES